MDKNRSRLGFQKAIAHAIHRLDHGPAASGFQLLSQIFDV
jgi:hypothetical protein